ncbi:OsmC family protein [Catenuloplanes sp. NPDC051500]|uniref:OsmC family protein n=1 Tax=Catenuloplanes sp. NPDC051500 TaxID=3363959 RepID=UPI0037B354B4
MSFRVETRTVDGTTIANGVAGPHTLVVGTGEAGLNGGQLLHLAVGACVSNDLFREAALRGITLTRVAVTVDGGFAGAPAVSSGISYAVEVDGDAGDAELRALVAHVDAIAEIPNSLRGGTPVRLVTGLG